MTFPVKSCVALSLCAFAALSHAYYVAGGRIYHDNGAVVSLRGVSWFGFETGTNSPHGLWKREMEDMVAQMKRLGFNAVRIPIAPSVLRGEPVSGIDWSMNPGLKGLNSLELLDHVIATLDAEGLYILLDHHRPDNVAISPLWYTANYSEKEWIDHLVVIAERYRDVDRYLGIQLKNEPHGRASWGAGDPATDWNRAAERAADALLAINPNILVFVGGIARNDLCSEGEGHWWGGNLEPIRCTPLDIPAHKLVLAPHIYGPDVYPQRYFAAADFPRNMPAIWDTHFGFAKSYGYTVVPTEFGSRYAESESEREAVWFDAFIAYLINRDVRDTFYWSWNPNSSDTGGILKDDWTTAWPDKLAKLHTLWGYADPSDSDDIDIGDAAEEHENAPPPQDDAVSGVLESDEDVQPEESSADETGMEAVLQVSKEIYNDWTTGYCARYRVRNESADRVQWRVHLPFKDELQSSWHGVLWVEDGVLTATGPSWSPTVEPFDTTTFYLCAERSADKTNADANAPMSTTLSGVQTITSDWGTGYCAKVRVKNGTDDSVIWQSDMPVQATIYDSWSVVLSGHSGLVRASGVDWNAKLGEGESAHFGFCATR